MSCEDCEKAQETKENAYYFRIDKANILVYGCQKHVAILQKIIRGGIK
jgi:hypothetical protein